MAAQLSCGDGMAHAKLAGKLRPARAVAGMMVAEGCAVRTSQPTPCPALHLQLETL